METNKTKALLIMVVILCVASICLGKEKDTLEAKLAKLEAATTVLKEKIIAKKLAKLEVRQKDFHKADKSMDTRITPLESELAVAPKWNMFSTKSSAVAVNVPDTTVNEPEVVEPEKSAAGSDYTAYLFGDLGGLRPFLDSKGIIAEMVYTSELFNNSRGGLNTHHASEYRGNFDVTLSVDTERLGLLPGSIFFYTQLGHGTSITSQHAGDTQTLSNIDAGYLFQVSEYWIEQLLFDGRLRVKLGKMDSNVDFLAVDYGGDFSQSSFAVVPTVPMPTFPDPALGTAVFLEMTEWLSLGAGVYEGAPKGGNSGFNTAFDRNRHGGMFSIYELTLKFLFGANKDLPGTYRIGGWHHSADLDEVGDDDDTRVFQSNCGFYLTLDQMLYHEKDDSDQGLGAFFQFGWTPENRNEIDRYFGAGLSYVGLIPGRDEDITGIGVAHALWSNRIDGFARETAVEFFYKIQLTEYISIKTDFHYIATPGGDGTIQDAVACGLRLEISF